MTDYNHASNQRPHDPPRVLCICAGGNVRSASVAYELKSAGIDAVPIGLIHNGRAVLELLADWADFIWVAETEMAVEIPAAAQSKVSSDIPIGPDIWGLVRHRDLDALSRGIAAQLLERINAAVDADPARSSATP